jgi:glutamate-1-semialdehyde 2,1-aminomutase
VAGTLTGLFFGTDEATDYDSARQTDEALYAAFFHEMLDRGVALAPGAFEVLFVGLAHTDDVLDQVLETAAAAAGAVAARL